MKAVILAGGLGMRLRPFTEVIPKPLLPLGEKALLEVQIESLRTNGFDEIFIATHYRSDYIKAYLGDGSRYGVRLVYSEEEKRLGTCGPLSLLRDRLTEPFLVINGDILTRARLRDVVEFSAARPAASLTIVTKTIVTPFRFGNVKSEDGYVTAVEEKPELEFEILAGIYALKPPVFEYIPYNQYFGMDDLIKLLLARKKKIARYLLKEYWIDIGRVEDYSEAVEEYRKHFTESDEVER